MSDENWEPTPEDVVDMATALRASYENITYSDAANLTDIRLEFIRMAQIALEHIGYIPSLRAGGPGHCDVCRSLAAAHAMAVGELTDERDTARKQVAMLCDALKKSYEHLDRASAKPPVSGPAQATPSRWGEHVMDPATAGYPEDRCLRCGASRYDIEDNVVRGCHPNEDRSCAMEATEPAVGFGDQETLAQDPRPIDIEKAAREAAAINRTAS